MLCVCALSNSMTYCNYLFIYHDCQSQLHVVSNCLFIYFFFVSTPKSLTNTSYRQCCVFCLSHCFVLFCAFCSIFHVKRWEHNNFNAKMVSTLSNKSTIALSFESIISVNTVYCTVDFFSCSRSQLNEYDTIWAIESQFKQSVLCVWFTKCGRLWQRKPQIECDIERGFILFFVWCGVCADLFLMHLHFIFYSPLHINCYSCNVSLRWVG